MPPKNFKPTRERKQRRITKNHSENDPNVNTDGSLVEPIDANAEIMIPLTAAEKAEKRRQQLKDELKEGMPKMSAKKAKRFNKYIENKLKKEESVAIMEKLAENKVDTSLFASTRSIGASRESKKQAIKRALLEEQAGINMEQNKQILYEERRVVGMEDYEEMQDHEMVDQPPKLESVSWAQARTVAEPAANPFAISSLIGAGLKRPLDGEDGPPVIKRIKKDRKPRKVHVVVSESEHSSDEEMPTSDEESEHSDSDDNDEGEDGGEEWNGFSEEEQEDEGSEESEDDEDGSSDESGSSDGESEDEPAVRKKPGHSGKANAFKEWALAQRRATDGETGTIKSNIEASMELKSTIVHIPRRREEDMTPPPEELVVANTDRKVPKATEPPIEPDG